MCETPAGWGAFSALWKLGGEIEECQVPAASSPVPLSAPALAPALPGSKGAQLLVHTAAGTKSEAR